MDGRLNIVSEEKISLPILTDEILVDIAGKILAKDIAKNVDWSYEKLSGGTVGAVFLVKGQALCTDGRVQPWSAVLKVQKFWGRFGDPLSWRREFLMYQSEIFKLLPEGLSVPKCYSLEDKGSEIWLWLEHLTGNHGENLCVADYTQVAHHMGRFQGTITTNLPNETWLSSRYTLVHYAADWGTGAIRWLQVGKERLRQLTAEMEQEIWELWAKRDYYLDLLRTLPCTLTHRDLTPGNVFVSGEKTSVLDWDCAGIGVLGEDMADLLAEALVYYDFDVLQAATLHEAIMAGYTSGLEASGWQGDKEDVRVAMAVHLAMHWCLRIVCCASRTEDPAMLERYRETLKYFLRVVNTTL